MLALVGACDHGPDLRPLQADAVVLAYGDSLTFGTGVAPEHAYPAELQRLLGRKVINAGVPGETSDAGLGRLKQALSKHRPHLVVLCHGGNDILRQRPPRTLEDNLRTMVKLIRRHDADVILLGVPGRNLTLRAPSAYENVAKELGVPLDDQAVPSIMRSPGLKSDPIHFNAAGYAAMARAAFDLLHAAGALAATDA